MTLINYLSSLSHDGEPCNMTVNGTIDRQHEHMEEEDLQDTFWYGVTMSIVADAIIAVALCTQKYAHNSNKGLDGRPIKHFLRLPVWWLGILMNVGGELGNMFAYGLAPAAVVAPVGSVGVIVNEIIAVCFLKEVMRKRDLLGLIFVIGGVVLVIACVPETPQDLSVHHILSRDVVLAPRCYWWLISLTIGIIVFICYLEPRYAQEYILVWLLLCSSISSLTVAAARSFSSIIRLIPTDCAASFCVHGVVHEPCSQTIGHWFFYLLIVIIAVTAVWSAMYLNKAMMVYGNTEVVPVYYCTFTVASIIGGALIYDELGNLTALTAVGFVGGILPRLRRRPPRRRPRPRGRPDGRRKVAEPPRRRRRGRHVVVAARGAARGGGRRRGVAASHARADARRRQRAELGRVELEPAGIGRQRRGGRERGPRDSPPRGKPHGDHQDDPVA